MGARLMVQQQFRQGKRTYRPGDELMNEDLDDWSAAQRANRFTDGFIAYDDAEGETVNGAVPGAKLRVTQPFTAAGRCFIVGEVFDRAETVAWPAISLGNRLEGGFLEWTTPTATDHPKAVKAKIAAAQAAEAAATERDELLRRHAEEKQHSPEDRAARRAARLRAEAERAARKAARAARTAG